MSFKSRTLNEKKEQVYAFYQRINKKREPYDKITRNDIYHNIISLYKRDPEIITRLCTIEEINILRKLLDGSIKKQENGYIDYLLFQDLKDNYLIVLENNEYSIPDDLLNYIKMALNLLDEKTFSITDVTDSVILGLSRIYNCLETSIFIETLKNYYINYEIPNLKDYIENNPKLNNKLKIIRYKKKEYITSLESPYYKDVLELHKNFKQKEYTLESVISIGKYKINLFQEELFQFLNFLEIHLNPESIDLFLNDLIFNAGFDINSENLLLQICDGIKELFNETLKVIPLLPAWIYNGNNLHTLKENIILPNKNESCICGSGKKFKNCCEKLFK